MEQYIKKSALVAEIEKRIKHYNESAKEFGDEGYNDNVLMEQCKANACEHIFSLLNTLEVKEVDLDALGVLAEHLIACDAHGVTPKYSDKEFDFLEGLAHNKTQKGGKA